MRLNCINCLNYLTWFLHLGTIWIGKDKEVGWIGLFKFSLRIQRLYQKVFIKSHQALIKSRKQEGSQTGGSQTGVGNGNGGKNWAFG